MAGWPSAAQRHELGSFPGHAGPEDVDRFFDLSPQDCAGCSLTAVTRG